MLTETRYVEDKVPGSDGIPNYVLKQLPPTPAIQRITNIYNAPFKLRTLGTTAKKIPSLKQGKPEFQPNSLGKILEKLILLQINRFLDDNDRLHPDQFGFGKGRSTAQQLCKITDAILTVSTEKNSPP